MSYDEARHLNHERIGTEHLLLGLIREADGLAGRVLAKLGVDFEVARSHVREMQGEPKTTDQTARQMEIPAVGGPRILPAVLTVTRLLGADMPALILLTTPSEDLTAALGKLNLEAGALARMLERRFFTIRLANDGNPPSVAGILDSATSAKSVFAQIANDQSTMTYQMLVDMGVTAEAFGVAFPD